jgi:hypothetical protein
MCCGAIAETQTVTMNRRTSRYVSEAFLNPMELPADFIETSPGATEATVAPEPPLILKKIHHGPSGRLRHMPQWFEKSRRTTRTL